jgi:hypothetical protein
MQPPVICCLFDISDLFNEGHLIGVAIWSIHNSQGLGLIIQSSCYGSSDQKSSDNHLRHSIEIMGAGHNNATTSALSL